MEKKFGHIWHLNCGTQNHCASLASYGHEALTAGIVLSPVSATYILHMYLHIFISCRAEPITFSLITLSF